jgi:hypothetical protein
VGDEARGCGGLNRSGRGRLGVWPAAPRDVAARNGRTRTQVRVGRGEGDDKPDRRAPLVSAEGERGEGGGAGNLGQDGGMGRSRVRERKKRGKRAVGGGREGKEGRERWTDWAGPKEEKRDGERGKIKQLLLNLKMKFELKKRQAKFQCKEHEMQNHMVFPIFIFILKENCLSKSYDPLNLTFC